MNVQRRPPTSAQAAKDGLDDYTPEIESSEEQVMPRPAHKPSVSDQSQGFDAWEDMDISAGLNVLSNPLMIADSQFVIRFVNDAAYKMFEVIESSIREDLPNFRAREVIGKSIDVFHKNPAFQRKMMADMVAPHDGKFTVGGKRLSFRATPVMNDGAKPSAYFVEWKENTADFQAEVEKENLLQSISNMSDAHARGEIDHFVEKDGFNEANATIIDGINRMVGDHINTKRKVLGVVAEFAKGNFDAPLERFAGKRAFLNDAVEETRAAFRKIFGQIQTIADALEKGKLDIDCRIDDFTGDYRTIVEALDRAVGSLNRTIANANEQVRQVAQTVEQVSKSSTSLAGNSQMQSSSVDEVSASAEETSIQVKTNASAADEAAKLVAGSAKVATEGSQKVAEMVTAMQGIKTSSQDIAKIIKVIDEIAFQTNLLALNAAVEAARAGQHGRGFAVVAQEVRNLAGRSAKAARETSDLIEDASSRVASGVRIADETHKSFGLIVNDIQQVQTLVSNIAVASEEQARGVTQINNAISDIAKSALSTSQQAEELAASAAQMAAATESMRREFDRFSLRRFDQNSTAFGINGVTSIDQLPPAMVAQLRSMMSGTAQNPQAGMSAIPKSSSIRSDADRDERGFGNF